MCFNITFSQMKDYIESRFGSSLDGIDVVQPIYHSSGFRLPDHPCILDSEPDHIRYVKWGLVPHWVKDEEQAGKIRFQTLNARSETAFRKPSFSGPIQRSRCLVLVDGFFESREFNGKKYPYLIRLRSERAFALAGMWDTWRDGKTFSILTTEANPLMANIHNIKKRMPVILPRKYERDWIDPGLSRAGIEELMVPYDENDMTAYTVSRRLFRRDVDTNIPEILNEVKYKELDAENVDILLFE
ncbi:MAG: SOS response-associated peptidase [Candidatus Thermoplasmatota archaeon]|nr:SOS response-associated peptidase [Candidatus Thermoplasmatota archaeon]